MKHNNFIGKKPELLMVSSIRDDVTPRSLILLFVKYPERGRVKSRLAAALGEGPAREIYKRFVGDMVKTLRKGRHPFRIFFYPEGYRRNMVRWLGTDIACTPQDGSDLGERMKNAFVRSFGEGIERVLIIGSDVPDLENRIIDEAFFSLDACDAVIGPASDGGYYLLGFRKTAGLPGIFRGIPWGTDSVFRETMTILRDSGISVHILPEWRDMDIPEDLKSLVIKNHKTGFRRSQTISYIMNNSQLYSLIMGKDSCPQEPQGSCGWER